MITHQNSTVFAYDVVASATRGKKINRIATVGGKKWEDAGNRRFVALRSSYWNWRGAWRWSGMIRIGAGRAALADRRALRARAGPGVVSQENIHSLVLAE
jgi:hypothetical protein